MNLIELYVSARVHAAFRDARLRRVVAYLSAEEWEQQNFAVLVHAVSYMPTECTLMCVS